MSKRKREAEDESDADGEVDTRKGSRTQRQQLEGVLERSKQTLFQALKLARGFERQKLGRRQKVANAAKDDGDGKRLAAEVTALKSLDLLANAEIHLYKSMLKTTSIASAPAFSSWVLSKLEEISKPYDVALANVQARLFNSQPVKKSMDDCMGNICTSLGLDGLQGGKRKRIRKADYRQDPKDTNVKATHNEIGEATRRSDVDKTTCVSSEIDGQLRDSDQASSSNEDYDYKKYDVRLAAFSDESFNGFSEASDRDYKEMRSKLGKVAPRVMPLSPSPESSDYSIESESSPPRKQAPKSLIPDTKATTFLPSLTMGGYWSGSESASDDEGGRNGTERKNRRGQRERRLIAEKKYGQNAKHLKNQPRGNDRDQGWDARKGAQEGDKRGKRGRGRGMGGKPTGLQAPRFTKGAASSSGANSDPVGPQRSVGKGKPTEGPLHPSWQAAKAAKEQKKAATFQGKKVVFD